MGNPYTHDTPQDCEAYDEWEADQREQRARFMPRTWGDEMSEPAKQPPEEHCSVCDDPTGRAGAGEDSIYWLDGEIGPLCESCSHQLQLEVLDDMGTEK